VGGQWTEDACRDLWATVLLKAVEDWEWCLGWLADYYDPAQVKPRDPRDFAAERLYWSCLEFWFHPDSPMSVYCEWVELEREAVLSKARELMKKNPLTAKVKKALARKPIWERPIQEALTVKWSVGRQKYGDLNPDEPFVGDPLLELYEELLDAMNYCREVRSQKVAETRGWVTALKGVAEEVRGALKGRDRG
jgi:hypothetical protein